MNVFQLTFKDKLQEWYNLRENAKHLQLDQKCIAIDNWWQKAPLVNHYLHPSLIEDWPGPWELINDNEYCVYARALGMVYTLHLTDTSNIEFYEAKDQENNELALIIVDHTYVLNYWPNTVQTNQLKDFDLIGKLNIQHLLDKIK
jgi:hypothetical protein